MLLDSLYITNITTSITSSNLEDINFLTFTKIDEIQNIKKNIIIIDSVKKTRLVAIYLQTFLFDKPINRDKDNIKSFSSIL